MSMTSAQIIEGVEVVDLSDDVSRIIDTFKASNHLYVFEIYKLAEWLIETNQQKAFICHAKVKQ